MPKLVITRAGVSLREYRLDRQRITIGRKPENDVCLDDETVSSEHAAVSLQGTPAITDLGSTNGTLVNGVRISKHVLHHGDVIRLGQHELKFIDESVQDLNATVVLTPGAAPGHARLNVLAGFKAGTTVALDQERTLIGKPGAAVAIVLREPGGFRLLAATAGVTLRVNRQLVPATGAALVDGDEIEIADNRIRFEESRS
jgi:hypothetical protein